MAAPWQPQQDGLQKVLQLIKDSAHSSNEVQQRIFQARLVGISHVLLEACANVSVSPFPFNCRVIY
jgi:hypothetical protein